MSGVIITGFLPEHASAAAEIERACFSEPWSQNSLLSSLEREDTVMLAAVLEGKAVGWAGFEHIFGEGSVLNIAVLPSFRRMGIGEALTSDLLKQGRALGLEWLMLEVRQSNAAAIGLYQKLGFEKIGVRPGFYSRPREDALLMRYYFRSKK